MYFILNNSVYQPENYGEEEFIEEKIEHFYLDFDKNRPYIREILF